MNIQKTHSYICESLWDPTVTTFYFKQCSRIIWVISANQIKHERIPGQPKQEVFLFYRSNQFNFFYQLILCCWCHSKIKTCLIYLVFYILLIKCIIAPPPIPQHHFKSCAFTCFVASSVSKRTVNLNTSLSKRIWCDSFAKTFFWSVSKKKHTVREKQHCVLVSDIKSYFLVIIFKSQK